MRILRVFDVLSEIRIGRLWLKGVLLAGGALLLALAFLLPLVSPVVTPPKWDEYIIVYDAQRVLDGQVPYRDFFNFIPPGTFHALRWVFEVFGGASITAARYASLVLVLLNASLLAAALRRAGWSLPQALLLALLYPVGLYPFWPIASHHWLVHLFCFGFLLAAAGKKPGTGLGRAVLLGLASGFAGCILQTEAVYLCAAGGVLLLLEDGEAHRSQRLAAFGLGLLPPIALTLGPLALHGAGMDFVRDVVLWPARNYSRPGSDNARLLLEDLPIRLESMWTSGLDPRSGLPGPFVAVSGTLFYLLLLGAAGVLLASAGLVLWKTLRHRRAPAPMALAACLATFLAFGLYLKGRPDWLRMIYLLPLLGGVWLLAAGRAGEGEAWNRRIVVGWAALALLSGAVFQGRWVWYHRVEAWELKDADRPIRESPVNRWLRSEANLRPGDRIAAFPEGGEVYLYTFPAAVRFTFFTPLSEGYHDASDHERAAQEMEKADCAMVLLTQEMEKDYLDPSSAVGRLLRTRYVREGAVAGAVVYRPKRD
ncbi:MAG: hypothetical protein ACOYXN_01645 [Acidobacteriota bacterium]